MRACTPPPRSGFIRCGLVVLATCGCAPSSLDTAVPVWGTIAVPSTTSLHDLALPEWSPAPTTSAADTLSDDLQGAVLKPVIVDWPITWTDERTQLAALYFQVHKDWDITPSTDLDAFITMDPQLVVVHWTAGPSARGAYNTFRNVRQRGQRIRREWNAVNLAAHFIVDRDGTIFQLMPADRMGRHTIGLHHLAIGIENVGDGARYPLTEAQLRANADLVRWLDWRHDLTHLIGHYEYRDFEHHPYFVEAFEWFRTGRIDPGKDFMADLRAELDDLGLEGSPLQDG